MDLQRNTTRYFTPMLWLLGPFLLPSCQDKHNKSTFQDPIIAESWNPDQHIPQIPQKIERPQRSSEHEKQSMFIALPQLLLLVHVYSGHSLLLNYIFSSVSVGYIIISIYIYKHSFLAIDCNNPMRFLSDNSQYSSQRSDLIIIQSVRSNMKKQKKLRQTKSIRTVETSSRYFKKPTCKATVL